MSIAGNSEGGSFESTIDRTLHWTVSIHIDNDRIKTQAKALYDALDDPGKGGSAPEAGSSFDRALARASHHLENQKRLSEYYAARARERSPKAEFVDLSAKLRDAIEPMFDDVADRERLGVVEDYMLAIPASVGSAGVTDVRRLAFRMSDRVSWATEGKTYQAAFEQPVFFDAELRRFWYVHRNLSISYHASFTFKRPARAAGEAVKEDGYRHDPQTFFFFSLLQKLVSPKEFQRHKGDAITLAGSPTIGPFQSIGIADPQATPADPPPGGATDFWTYFANLFEVDFSHLYTGLVAEDAPALSELVAVDVKPPARLSAWEHILLHEPYVAVPGLKMPQVRQMFYFADEVFRDLLLPKLTDGTPASRYEMMREDFFEDRLQAALEVRSTGRPAGRLVELPDETIEMGSRLWGWFKDENADIAAEVTAAAGDAEALAKIERGPIDPLWLVDHSLRTINPRLAGKDPRRGRDGKVKKTNLGLAYLFLAGFNQNIIDFINQDSSEVLDSLDPIYPEGDDDDLMESFFARFANPRALITYVRKMRSLETGNDYIGTCPYAFLIHVLAMHNEFLARDFEYRADRTIGTVDDLVRVHEWKGAAEKFYNFRQNEQREYIAHHYENVFRYDTEGKVFTSLEKIRGIKLTHEYSQQLLDGAKSTTDESEARILRDEDRNLNYLVFTIGMFSVIQVLLQWGEITACNAGDACADMTLTFFFGASQTDVSRMALAIGEWSTILASIGAIAISVLIFNPRRRWRNIMALEAWVRNRLIGDAIRPRRSPEPLPATKRAVDIDA